MINVEDHAAHCRMAMEIIIIILVERAFSVSCRCLVHRVYSRSFSIYIICPLLYIFINIIIVTITIIATVALLSLFGLLLFRSPSDNVQHELQRRSLRNTARKKYKSNTRKNPATTYTRICTTPNCLLDSILAASPLLFVYLLSFFLPSDNTFTCSASFSVDHP